MDYSPYDEYEIRQELDEDETTVWSGQPNPNVLFSKADIFLVPFTLVWAGMAFFFTIKALTIGQLGIFLIMPLFFCIVGVYVTVGRFAVKRRRKQKTIYALTDKRVIEIVLGRNRKVKTVHYSQIAGLNSTIRGNGRGTISFGNANSFQELYANTGMDFGLLHNSFPVFYDLDQADIVLRIIKEQIKKANQ